MKKQVSHTTFRNGKFFCTHCGEYGIYKVPIAINDLVKLIRAFNKKHGHCKPVWKQPEPDMKASIEERMRWWALEGEHGTSSKTIFTFFCLSMQLSEAYLKFYNDNDCMSSPIKWHHPSDPDDFRRCSMLLKTIPEWKKPDELAKISDVWKQLAHHWDTLEKMLEEKDPKMYEFMKTLGC